MESDQGASACGSLVLGRILMISFLMNSTGDVGAVDGLFTGVADEDFLWKWCIADNRTTEYRRHRPQCGSHGRSGSWDSQHQRQKTAQSSM